VEPTLICEFYCLPCLLRVIEYSSGPTLCCFLAGKLRAFEALMYALSQCIGCLIAGACLAITYGPHQSIRLGTPSLAPGVSVGQGDIKN
jgi:hypothetical protein